jgi:hypothetical protein
VLERMAPELVEASVLVNCCIKLAQEAFGRCVHVRAIFKSAI